MHTRFEHSLGVMELATRALNSIVSKAPDKDIVESSLKKIGWDLEEAINTLRLAALLHDIGHLPFSHAAEGNSILPNGKTHEDVTARVIRESDLTPLLERSFGSSFPSQILDLVAPGTRFIRPELKLLKQIISGQLDVDRADYLLRDSLHCGVLYGSFDYHRLFETLRVVESPEGGLELGIDRGGIHNLEALLLARYYMYSQVYFHHTRRIYDLYLSEYMSLRFWANLSGDLLSILNFDDYDVLKMIKDDAISFQKDKVEILAKRIFDRKHHRVTNGSIK